MILPATTASTSAFMREPVWATNERGRKAGPPRYQTANCSIRGSAWCLSDHEWAAIKPIVAPTSSNRGQNRKHDLRTLVDGVIEKIGSGVPWQKMAYTAGDWRNACRESRKP